LARIFLSLLKPKGADEADPRERQRTPCFGGTDKVAQGDTNTVGFSVKGMPL
jgi:hypothetical protein